MPSSGTAQPAARLLDPSRATRAGARRPEAGGELCQRTLRVADDDMVDGEGPGGVERFDVELDEGLPPRIQEVGRLVDGVRWPELGADSDNEVRVSNHCIG
jgi:hypothetical protein